MHHHRMQLLSFCFECIVCSCFWGSSSLFSMAACRAKYSRAADVAFCQRALDAWLARRGSRDLCGLVEEHCTMIVARVDVLMHCIRHQIMCAHLSVLVTTSCCTSVCNHLMSSLRRCWSASKLQCTKYAFVSNRVQIASCIVLVVDPRRFRMALLGLRPLRCMSWLLSQTLPPC
jgi:hypothetical protein